MAEAAGEPEIASLTDLILGGLERRFPRLWTPPITGALEGASRDCSDGRGHGVKHRRADVLPIFTANRHGQDDNANRKCEGARF